MTSGRYAPFIHTHTGSSFINFSSIIALLPCVAFGVFKYGLRALILILVSSLLAAFLKYLLDRMEKPDNKVFDYSILVPGALFALLLPPDTSLVVAVVGILFMVVVIYKIFGGNGCNIVNGAIAARLFVEMIWPSYLRGFTTHKNEWAGMSSLISFSKLPLSGMPSAEDYHLSELLVGGYPGFIGTGSLIMILIGFIYLIRSGTVKLNASFGYIVTFMAVRLIKHYDEGLKTFASFIIISSVLFIAVFVMTDRTTIPQTGTGGYISGISCGILTAALFEVTSGIIALLVPVIAVNLISGMVEYLTSYAAERHVAAEAVEEETDGF
jgi:Na+-translocating ferredoxin:NAD+ oxidoreductase RnfD subunit